MSARDVHHDHRSQSRRQLILGREVESGLRQITYRDGLLDADPANLDEALCQIYGGINEDWDFSQRNNAKLGARPHGWAGGCETAAATSTRTLWPTSGATPSSRSVSSSCFTSPRPCARPTAHSAL
jgi:hypothetical protein